MNPPLSLIEDRSWLQQPPRQPHAPSIEAAVARQARLTKPGGALGDLESLVIALAGHQARECPQVQRPEVFVFAADHGVTARGVSAYPQAVTAQMVFNFLAGGAAINVLAAHQGARLTVVDVGVKQLSIPESTHFLSRSCNAAGTADFVESPALTEAELHQALAVGRDCVALAVSRACDVFIAGEMGIGNTTSASALVSALLGLPAALTVGLGTGISADVHARKCQIVDQALCRHAAAIGPTAALETLRCLGGYEIAAMVGAILACAQQGLTFLVDGFIVSAAALVAVHLQPDCRSWLLFAHCSAEAGHNAVLSALEAKPLMNLGMRLGEGSGAAVALSLLRVACALHAGMATFESAGVSGQSSGL